MGNKSILLFTIIVGLLLYLALVPVYAQEKYDEVAEAFYRALEEGNYSIVYPYFSHDLKNALTEEKFKIFRSQLFSGYGSLKDYYFVKEEKVESFTRAYYIFVFERANITFMLVFEKRQPNNKYILSGVWIKSVQARSSNQGLLILPIIGSLLPLFLIYLFIRRKIKYKEFFQGIILVILILFAQSPIQQIPFLIFKVYSKDEILSKGILFTVLASIWFGAIAGILQESLKYIFSKGKPLENAMFIGLGFGVGEAITLSIISLSSYIMGHSALIFSLEMGILSFIERFLVSLFHGGTTTYFAYSFEKGYGLKTLIIFIIIHMFIDSLTIFYQFTSSITILAVAYLVLISLDVLLIKKLYRLIKM